MQKWLQSVLTKPVLFFTEKFNSRPKRSRVFAALSYLLESLKNNTGKKGLKIPFDAATGRFIIFSDLHKGNKNGADDFEHCEPNMLAAYNYYFDNGFTLILLGDSEELWENNILQVKSAYPECFELEKKFAQAGKLIKIFGNHDLYWDNDPLAWWYLLRLYEVKLKVYEAVLLTTDVDGVTLDIFCTHGHQGDAQSDGNWFSKFFVSRVWAPLQAYLSINPNTPAYNSALKTLHNQLMYEWSSDKKNTLLVTGHTHQPVFKSLTHIERLLRELETAKAASDKVAITKIQLEIKKLPYAYEGTEKIFMDSVNPSYFNSGCCCFSDGDITGLEIADGQLSLVKWTQHETGTPLRTVPQQDSLAALSRTNNAY